jgi:hypothetical protein
MCCCFSFSFILQSAFTEIQVARIQKVADTRMKDPGLQLTWEFLMNARSNVWPDELLPI